jgi:hypothetical protein
MKAIQKKFKDVGNALDGAATNLGQGVTFFANRIGDGLGTDKQQGRNYNAPPQVSEVPAFAEQEVSEWDAGKKRMARTTLPGRGTNTPTDSPLAKSDEGSVWWQENADRGDYLCISVREARNLPIVDFNTRSTSS